MAVVFDELKLKFNQKQAKVAVIGLGYVGLPLALAFLDVGYQVVGLDIDPEKPQMLHRGESYINHIDASSLKAAYEEKRFVADTQPQLIAEVDAIILCLPTPLGVHQEPDLSYITQTLDWIATHLREGQIIVLESTTYPGTTEELFIPYAEKLGFKVGENFFIGYSPEREDPANPNFTTTDIPKIYSGVTKNCTQICHDLYAPAFPSLVCVSDTKTAEMTKILENSYRAINIALVNELKMVADKMDIDIFEVIKAAATKPFGFTAFYPGPGLGGHCIPIDPFYLTWKAREFDIRTRFIELAGEINTAMPDYVIQKIILGLNQKGLAISRSKILLLGLAYKKNVNDLRESPSLVILKKLQDLGANVNYSDPFIPSIPKNLRKHDLSMNSLELSPQVLSDHDVVIVCTDHDSFDWDLIQNHATLIIDTRGRFKEDKQTVIRA